MKILMVCLGNICRSPMAEGILRKKAEEMQLKLEVDSAGTANYHVGESPDPRAIETAAEFGVDISGLRGRQFSVKDFDRFDVIYAMDHSNFKNIVRLCRDEADRKKVRHFLTNGSEGLDVPDPWFGEREGFYSVFELLSSTCDKIIFELTRDNTNKK